MRLVPAILASALLLGAASVPSAAEPARPADGWTPPKAGDWVGLGARLNAAYEEARKQTPRIGGGAVWGPEVCVDRTDGTLYAFPQGGPLWVSRDRGQTFEWFNRDVLNWGFNESPTNLYVAPDGKKIRVFSSNRSGFSLDGGKTWQYMNFTLKFGFEDGQINWDGKGDGRTIVARSHTWPSRMWLSRDAGQNFAEFAPEIMKQSNTQNIALLDDDVMMFQNGSTYQAGKLVRSEDHCKTLQEVADPTHVLANGKTVTGGFIGLSRRFQGRDYWLNTIGVYTTADKGKSWTPVGAPFPNEYVEKRTVRSGPLFGKDADHMLVLCLDCVLETTDGGKSWHVLAELPKRLTDNPWAHSFAYDPLADILYCNNREHGGGPYLFGRLALKRWGPVDGAAPTAPANLEAEVLPAGNGARLRWAPSTDASGIYMYRVYVDGTFLCCTDRTELELRQFAWKQELKVAVRAVDWWQNLSPQAEATVRLGDRPAGTDLLRDMKPAAAEFDGKPMRLVRDSDPDAGKAAGQITCLMEGFEQNPVPRHVRRSAVNCIGIPVTPDQKAGVLEYALDGKYTRLKMDLAISNSEWNTVQVKVLVDGKPVAEPKPLAYETVIRGVGRPPEILDVDLTKARTLRFEVNVVNPRYWRSDMVVLGNALLFTGQ